MTALTHETDVEYLEARLIATQKQLLQAMRLISKWRSAKGLANLYTPANLLNEIDQFLLDSQPALGGGE